MTTWTIFECDNCGDRTGAKNDVIEVPIRHLAERHEHPEDETLHLCPSHDGVNAIREAMTYGIARFVVDRDSAVVGILGPDDEMIQIGDAPDSDEPIHTGVIEDASETVERVA